VQHRSGPPRCSFFGTRLSVSPTEALLHGSPLRASGSAHVSPRGHGGGGPARDRHGHVAMRCRLFHPAGGVDRPIVGDRLIPDSCIAGVNNLTVGFASSLLDACGAYWLGDPRGARRSRLLAAAETARVCRCRIYMDEYVGARRLRMKGIVIEALPGRRLVWQLSCCATGSPHARGGLSVSRPRWWTGSAERGHVLIAANHALKNEHRLRLMQTFAVPIEGEDLDQVRVALNGAGIPTIGPPTDIRFVSEPVEQAHVGHRMAAILDADTATAAEATSSGALARRGLRSTDR
jgi:hypothetical protein